MNTDGYAYVGIDLGTTFSSVGYVDTDGRIKTIKIDNNQDSIRSIVSIGANNCLFGDTAIKSNIDTSNLIYEVKRFMGKKSDDNDENLEKLKKLTPNKFVDIDGKVGIEVSFQSGNSQETIQLTPEQVSTLILMKLKTHIEKQFPGQKIKAVVGVPAAFGDQQRDATKNAVKMAGMECIALLNEPTAASRAGEVMDGTVFVFDFGGGTLDISIVEFKNGSEEVKVTKGNPFLGGNNIDYVIMEYIRNLLREKLDEDYADDEELHEMFEELLERKKKILKNVAEDVKREMSKLYSNYGEDAVVKFVLDDEFKNLSMSIVEDEDAMYILEEILQEEYEISYHDFDRITAEIFNACQDLINESIQELGSKKAVDKVLLVGGSCKNPQVRIMLETAFGKQKVVISDDIESLVTKGLARRANVAENKIAQYSTDKGDVITHDIEIRTIDPETGYEDYVTIIEKNHRIPCHIGGTFDQTNYADDEPEFIFQPSADGMTEMVFELFESRKKWYNFTIKEIPSLPKGTAEVKIIFDVGTDGKLKIQAQERSKKKNTVVVCEPTISNMTDNQLKELGTRMQHIFEHGAGKKKQTNKI